MNKSRRARKGGEGGSTAQKEGNEKTEEKKKEKKEEEKEARSSERKIPIKPHVPATYSIFTTLKFPPKGKRPALHQKPPSGKQPQQDTSFQYQESKKSVPDTSFYYKDNSSSNYDLTLARKEQEVVAEVHEASPKVSKQSKLTSADLLIFSRRGALEKEVQVLCHCCHQGWNELKDSTPSEPCRRGLPKNCHLLSLSLCFQVQKDDPGSKTVAGEHKTLAQLQSQKQETKS